MSEHDLLRGSSVVVTYEPAHRLWEVSSGLVGIQQANNPHLDVKEES